MHITQARGAPTRLDGEAMLQRGVFHAQPSPMSIFLLYFSVLYLAKMVLRAAAALSPDLHDSSI